MELNHTANSESPLRVSDEVWIVTALLHQEQPDHQDFTIQEIVERAHRENLFGSLRPGVVVHASLHCVANKAPSPAGYRILFATGKHSRRLYRPGDPSHPQRKGKTTPRRNHIPERYRELLDWYEKVYVPASPKAPSPLDRILGLRGLGKEIWQGIDPGDYVRQLREGWE